MANPSVLVKTKTGGMKMEIQEIWNLFLETGAPEAYLLYRNACRMEANDVPDDSGLGAAGNGLQ